MKKVLSMILAVVMLCAMVSQIMLPASAASDSGKCGDDLTWVFDPATGALTISGTGAMENYGWEENFTPWYNFSESIKTVTIENGVTSIGNYAFARCLSLTSVTIPDSVLRIGHGAFCGCSSLTSVTIPDSVLRIGGEAFCDCSSLTSVTISNSVPSIRAYTFMFCSSLTNVTIPDSVTNIDDGAFFGCSGLTSITIPNSVTNIGNSAFLGCSSLTSITIPDSVTNIGNSAFASCENLTSVTIPDGVQLGVGVFFYCTRYICAMEDVSSGDWFYDAVKYVLSNALFNGMGENRFEPETAMDRAMLVTVLWRHAGTPKEGSNQFADIDEEQWHTAWYRDAVAWASSNGIVNGVGGGKFDPNGNVTREQVAAILYRYAAKKGYDTSKRGDLSSFPDKDQVSFWAADAMSWAVGEGLISGSKEGGKTYILPTNGATRAQVATILMRFIQNTAKPE